MGQSDACMTLWHITIRPVYGHHGVLGVTTERGLYMGLHCYLYALCVYIVIIAVLLNIKVEASSI